MELVPVDLQDDGPDVPERLRRDLKALYGAGFGVPGEVDGAILARGRRRLTNYGRFRRIARWGAGIAAAAVIAVGVRLAVVSQRPPVNAAGIAVAKAEDVNRDGKVNVVDAYLLAKQIREKLPLKMEWDFNHDGVVDTGDVRVVAANAVAVSGEAVK